MARRGRRVLPIAATTEARSASPPPAYSPLPPSPATETKGDETTPLLRPANSSGHGKLPTTRMTGCKHEQRRRLAWGLMVASVLIFASFCCLSVVLASLDDSQFSMPVPTYSIAIIGAGPAGISTAKHLAESEAAHKVKLNITIFDSVPLVGGRLALRGPVHGQVVPYGDITQDPVSAEDLAGPALMWNAPFFTDECEKYLGLGIDFDELPSSEVGYFDGKNLVSTSTLPYRKTSWSSWLSQIWRYHSSVWRIEQLSTPPVLGLKWMRTTSLRTVRDIQFTLGHIPVAHSTANSLLETHGISHMYIDEVVGPRIRKATGGQEPGEVSGLALFLALARDRRGSPHVGGDFAGIMELILQKTTATLLTSSPVTGIRREQLGENESAWIVEYATAGSESSSYAAFDRVILAAPGAENAVVQGAEKAMTDPIAYRPVHVAFFTSSTPLDPLAFGATGSLPAFILPINAHKEGKFQGIFEIAHVRDLHRKRDGALVIEHLYRCLSDHDVSDFLQHAMVFEEAPELDTTPGGITWIHTSKIEPAYPLLYPAVKLPDFKLSEDGLWTTSAVNAIGDTIELSWLAGQIVARDLLSLLSSEA